MACQHTRNDVAYFVPQHSGKAVFIFHYWQNSSKHAYLATFVQHHISPGQNNTTKKKRPHLEERMRLSLLILLPSEKKTEQRVSRCPYQQQLYFAIAICSIPEIPNEGLSSHSP